MTRQICTARDHLGCPHCGGGPWRHVRDLPNESVIVQCRECKAATDLKEWEA